MRLEIARAQLEKRVLKPMQGVENLEALVRREADGSFRQPGLEAIAEGAELRRGRRRRNAGISKAMAPCYGLYRNVAGFLACKVIACATQVVAKRSCLHGGGRGRLPCAIAPAHMVPSTSHYCEGFPT